MEKKYLYQKHTQKIITKHKLCAYFLGCTEQALLSQ